MAPRPVPEVMTKTSDGDALYVALSDTKRRLRLFQVGSERLGQVCDSWRSRKYINRSVSWDTTSNRRIAEHRRNASKGAAVRTCTSLGPETANLVYPSSFRGTHPSVASPKRGIRSEERLETRLT